MGTLKKEHVGKVRDLLENRSAGSDPVGLDTVMDFAAVSAESFQNADGFDPMAIEALASISREIGSMKSEISKLQIHDMKKQRIPEAGRELDAIVEATEDATNTIMEAAEAIMGADPEDHEAFSGLVTDKVMEIFEACSFQDITGQRISKVVQTINHIDERISTFVDRLRLLHHDLDAEDAPGEETEEEKRKRELILHGPQFKGEGVDQSDVDRMLNDTEDSQQSEIDKLFG